MRQAIWIVMSAILLAATGCNEFVTSDKPAPTTSVDVVGDPSDPVADSTEESDILAAETIATGHGLANADSNVDVIESVDQSAQSPSDIRGPESAASTDKSKSASPKTTHRESTITK